MLQHNNVPNMLQHNNVPNMLQHNNVSNMLQHKKLKKHKFPKDNVMLKHNLRQIPNP